MSLFRGFKSFIGLGPSKEEQQQELERLKQEMAVGTPVQKKQKEIEYNELFYKVYPKSITEQAYTEYMSRLNQELAAAIKEQGTPSIYEGWEPAATAATAATADREMNVLNGGKKKSKRTKSKKSKRTKSKKSKRTKSKKSKRTKSKKLKRTKTKKSKRTKK
jgi:hypothetical protein